MDGQILSFGPYGYDPATATLRRDGAIVPLGTRATAVLAALLEAAGEVVAHEKLIARAWNGAIVEDSNLAVQIAGLRKTLGPRDDGTEWITTVPRVGYRLAADTHTAPDGRPAFAVLPFINMSPDPDLEYFADGMVEDLITAFSRFKSFSVVSRQSSFVYKNRQFDIREAAHVLRVRYLLEGSVRRSGDRIRVVAQLIDGTNGEHIWAEKLDGALDDVFDFQDRVTTGVVGLIEPHIRRTEVERAHRKRPENLSAYDLYLRALPLMQSSRVQGYTEALVYLDRALELDPNYGPVLSLAAMAHDKRKGFGGTAPPGVDDSAEARALAARAMVADSSDAIAVMVAGTSRLGFDPEGGRALVERAFEINPNYPMICNTCGWIAWSNGEFDRALQLHLRAVQLSPASPEAFWGLSALGRTHLSAGHFEEALVWAQRALDSNPKLDYARGTIIAAYSQMGMMDEAHAALAELRAESPDASVATMVGTPVRPQYSHMVEGLTRAGLT